MRTAVSGANVSVKSPRGLQINDVLLRTVSAAAAPLNRAHSFVQ